MIHELINNIFIKHTSNIYNNNRIIHSQIDEKDLLYYKFKYSEGTKTKDSIVSSINFFTKTIHHIIVRNKIFC